MRSIRSIGRKRTRNADLNTLMMIPLVFFLEGDPENKTSGEPNPPHKSQQKARESAKKKRRRRLCAPRVAGGAGGVSDASTVYFQLLAYSTSISPPMPGPLYPLGHRGGSVGLCRTIQPHPPCNQPRSTIVQMRHFLGPPQRGGPGCCRTQPGGGGNPGG